MKMAQKNCKLAVAITTFALIICYLPQIPAAPGEKPLLIQASPSIWQNSDAPGEGKGVGDSSSHPDRFLPSESPFWSNAKSKRALYSRLSSGSSDNRSLYKIEFDYRFNQQFALGLKHAQGWEIDYLRPGRDAHWYDLNSHFRYEISRDFAVGTGMKWLRDEDGARLGEVSSNYYQATMTMSWQPRHWLRVEPQVSYDWSEKDGSEFSGSQSRKLAFTIDAVIAF